VEPSGDVVVVVEPSAHFEEVQGIYLGRPPRGPVEYGPDDADLTLVVDRAEPDPGDLTGGPAGD
jgi:hypothetical protein